MNSRGIGKWALVTGSGRCVCNSKRHRKGEGLFLMMFYRYFIETFTFYRAIGLFLGFYHIYLTPKHFYIKKLIFNTLCWSPVGVRRIE